MMFIRKSLDPEGEADGAAYEAVANILMGRDQLERLVPMLQQVLEYWEGEGI